MLSPTRIPTPDAELERGAFNAAFYQLGLPWYWDSETYDGLSAVPGERDRVQRYLRIEQAHLLRAYDADVLADTIVEAKERCARALGHCAAQSLPRVNWADARWGETGF
jgi:hypothetical protein